MHKNPNLYEINTRVWIKRFGENVKLHEVQKIIGANYRSWGSITFG